jgi:hypothetical protein
MKAEIATFSTGIYDKPCELFSEIKIGSVLCVGHSVLGNNGCKYCVSYKTENSYYLEILEETTPIVSEVLCNRPAAQLTMF